MKLSFINDNKTFKQCRMWSSMRPSETYTLWHKLLSFRPDNTCQLNILRTAATPSTKLSSFYK